MIADFDVEKLREHFLAECQKQNIRDPEDTIVALAALLVIHVYSCTKPGREQVGFEMAMGFCADMQRHCMGEAGIPMQSEARH